MKLFNLSAFTLGVIACALGQTPKYTAAWANTPDCPLKILGAGITINKGKADIFGQVTVANSSPKEVTSVKLAWSIEGDSSTSAVFGFGAPKTLSLASGDVDAIGGQGADATGIFQILGAAASANGSVTLAVVLVGFKDGTEWKKEIDSATAFRNTESPEAYALFAAKHQQILTEMRAGEDPSKKK